MNNIVWQFACIILLLLCAVWNRAAWGDPKWPLFGLVATLAVWVLLALYALVGSLWAVSQGRAGGIVVFSLIFAMVPLVGAVLFLLKIWEVPPIHDVSTDTVNPPEFVLAKEIRHPSHNSLVYAPKNAELQRRAYPSVNAVFVSRKPSEVIVMAEKAALKLGWKIYDVARRTNVIEAYTETPLLRFVDDIVIRVEHVSANESRLDIRSASRVGMSDLGANAARIQLFFEAFSQQLTLPLNEGASNAEESRTQRGL
jgi:hypothetical protein